jgi:hypothetical protein
MYTSMIGLAVAAWLSSATPNFQTDYRDAKALAARESKPLLVVLCTCTGEAAWNRIATEGSLGTESLKVLRESYVCVYVDTATDRGRRLAADFDLTNGPALIISDKTGEVQAYRHDGALPASQLAEVFKTYANPDRIVSTTDSNRATTSNYAPAYFTPPALQQQCLT